MGRIWDSVRYNIHDAGFLAGESIWRQGSRAINRVGAFFDGNGSYNYIRYHAQSFKTRELIDERYIRKDLKIMARIDRHLKYFDEAHLNKLLIRYSVRPNSFISRVNKLLNTYMHDLNLFLLTYKNFLTMVNDSLVSLSNQREAENNFIGQTVEELTKALKSRHAYLPEQLIQSTIHELNKLRVNKARLGKADFGEDVKIDRIPRMGVRGVLFKAIWGYWFRHKWKKTVGRISKGYMDDLVNNMQVVMLQIKQKRIQPDVLTRLLYHFKYVESFDKMYRGINHDILMLIILVKFDFDEFMDNVATFLTIFKNVQVVRSSKVPKMMEEFKVLQNQLHQILARDELNQSQLIEQINSIGDYASNSLEAMKALSNEIKAEIRANPLDAMHRLVK